MSTPTRAPSFPRFSEWSPLLLLLASGTLSHTALSVGASVTGVVASAMEGLALGLVVAWMLKDSAGETAAVALLCGGWVSSLRPLSYEGIALGGAVVLFVESILLVGLVYVTI